MPVPWVAIATALAGATQAYLAHRKTKKANEKLERLFNERKAYQTPAEVFDIANLTQSNAQQGFSDQTMNYFTGQAGGGLSGSLQVAKQLGADPNQLGGVLDKYYGDIFRIGAESDLVKMKNFDSFTNALLNRSAHTDAEWQSSENIIKDQMQRQVANIGANTTSQQSGYNLLLAGASAAASADLYGDKDDTGGGDGGTSNRNNILAWNKPLTVPQAPRIDLPTNRPGPLRNTIG